MSDKEAAAFALSKVGQGYIYGAKGQVCTEKFRRQQANQYPDQAKYILNVGRKWDGVPVWDCAQLTRYAARAAGVTLPSGATSQWRKGPWKRKGEIGALPEGEVLFLYRQKGSVMQHTGIALGDGTCVHARGTAYGVIRQPLAGYAWTHWASPWEGLKMPEKEEETDMETAIVHADSGSTVRMRSGPGKGYTPVLSVPVDMEVEVLEWGLEWSRIRVDGEEGYMMSQYLHRSAKGATVEQRLAELEKRVSQIEEKMGAGT
jgi:hypothetical protein